MNPPPHQIVQKNNSKPRSFSGQGVTIGTNSQQQNIYNERKGSLDVNR